MSKAQKQIVYDSPVQDSNGEYVVVVQDEQGKDVTVRYSLPQTDDGSVIRGQYKCDMQLDKTTPSYWVCRTVACKQTDSGDVKFAFSDEVELVNNTVRSMRDGVQIYRGSELGIEPTNKIFKIYRSPNTVANVANALKGVPVIEGHIDPSIAPTDEQIIGTIDSSEVVSSIDSATDSTLVIENKVSNLGDVKSLADKGKAYFSLGYLSRAMVSDNDAYDFEMTDIEPKHLGQCRNPRGGKNLKLLDKGIDMTKKVNTKDADVQENDEQDKDEQNKDDAKTTKTDAKKTAEKVELKDSYSFDEIMQIIYQLPDTIRSMNIENLAALEPQIDQLAQLVRELSLPQTTTDEVKMTDLQAFKDAIGEQMRIAVKAKDFLGESYDYTQDGKKIMRDAVLSQHKELELTDEEVAGAFKMLQQQASHVKQNVTIEDSGDSAIEKIKKMEA